MTENERSVHNGVSAVVKGTTIGMRNAGAVAVAAQGDVSVNEGGAQLMIAGGDLTIRQGGAQSILARGDVSIQEGGAILLAGADIDVRESWIGVALGRNVRIANSRVLLTPVTALCAGAGFGLAAAVVRRLLGR